MGEFGISEQAIRQAVSRMSRQGWLAAAKRGEPLVLRTDGTRPPRVEAISPRIYGPVVEWDGRWRMLTYSVAESQAAKDATACARISPSWDGRRCPRRRGFRRTMHWMRPALPRKPTAFSKTSISSPANIADRAPIANCWKGAGICRRSRSNTAISSPHYEPRLQNERAASFAFRRGSVRRTHVARTRLPQIYVRRSGIAEHAASGALARHRGCSSLPRILLATFQQGRALLHRRAGIIRTAISDCRLGSRAVRAASAAAPEAAGKARTACTCRIGPYRSLRRDGFRRWA